MSSARTIPDFARKTRLRLGTLSACLCAALFLSLPGTAQADADLPRIALPDPMPAPPLTMLLPVPETRIDAAISALDELGQSILDRSGVPGLAVAVVHGGQTVYARGFGLRAVGDPALVDADTVFLLASVSKPVGATVVATQVAAGRVSWDDPVRSYLPWFDLGDPWISEHVTIGDLYAHRSGLPDHAGDDLEDLGFDRRAVLDRLALLPKGRFRLDYAYTNFGLTAAAEAVASAAGTDWASLSEQTIYQPLGMTATSSRHVDFMARDNRASSHVPNGDTYVIADRRQPDAQSPAGGVSSSVHDMARWMAMVLGNGTLDGTPVIAPEALRPALSPQMISGLPMQVSARSGAYGYGFNVGVRPSGRVELSHSGAFALGASTSISMLPDLGLGIVVLTNAPPTGAPEALAAAFLDRVELGLETRDWLAGYSRLMAPLSAPVGQLVGATPPTDPAPAQPDPAYLGTYHSAYFGPAEVSAGPDGLELALGPDKQTLALQHWDGDSFVVTPDTENQPTGSISQVTFQIDATGAAANMWVEHLDGDGLGAFLRQD
ncbi:serine hydrolase [Fluviibacterium sp. S390]|uniref:serine hydrolase n=1 Tax=Fluviibacterium sp. S390 TaxID=3415139 RepID=UPI003C7D608C